jgi:hypothetical protein
VELGGKAHHTQVDGEVALVIHGIVVINACQKGGDYNSIDRVEYRIQERSTMGAVVIDDPLLGLKPEV